MWEGIGFELKNTGFEPQLGQNQAVKHQARPWTSLSFNFLMAKMGIIIIAYQWRELTSLGFITGSKNGSNYYHESRHLWMKPTLKDGLKVVGWEALRTPIPIHLLGISLQEKGLAGCESRGSKKEGVNRRAAICMEWGTHGNTRVKTLSAYPTLNQKERQREDRGSVVTNPSSIHEDAVQSLGSISGLRIRHCHELGCRSQTWLRSCIAVAVG